MENFTLLILANESVLVKGIGLQRLSLKSEERGWRD